MIAALTLRNYRRERTATIRLFVTIWANGGNNGLYEVRPKITPLGTLSQHDLIWDYLLFTRKSQGVL